MLKQILAMGTAALLSGAATAQELYPLQPHPDGVAWATDEWPRVSAPPEDVDTEAVEQLVRQAMEGVRGDVMGETRAIVIIRGGELVLEAYNHGFGRNTKQVSWSVAKSITHGLVGRAAQRGLIASIDDHMPSPFVEDDPRAAISWRQWLNMTDGLDHTEVEATSLAENDAAQMLFGAGASDIGAYARREMDVLHPPGEVWNYSTAGYNLIGAALQRVESGERPAPDATFGSALFDSIGADIQPEFGPDGTYLGGALVYASARDFAKFGYLYLRDGMWDGERLLPEGWVDFARTDTPATNSNVYGAGFWITAPDDDPTRGAYISTPPWDSFHAGGSEGQTIWIVPSKDLVVVRLGLMQNSDEDWQALYEWNQALSRTFPDVVSESVNAPAADN
ncbi:MAG: serine hydrolase [Pseudomonadota bacterium]